MPPREIECYRCKIPFHVPEYWYLTRRQDHLTFWCPNGHEQHFTEGESEAARERRLRQRAEQQIARLEDEKRAALQAAAAAERKARRVQLRANRGVCQCCNRTFANVARHMATKHPEMAKPKLAEKVATA